MKVIKNINNNVSLCIDSKGREVIAFGNGIGFIKPPYQISLDRIDRTFYNINDWDYEGIADIPSSVIKASIRIVDDVEKNLNVTLMSTTALALADHINFAIQRQNDSIELDLQIQHNIKILYPNEIQEARKAFKIVEEETGVILGENEIGPIALHFINNQLRDEGKEEKKRSSKEILLECVQIIEKEFKFQIDKDSFNYSRFATHLDYLIRRVLTDGQIKSENSNLFITLKTEYPKSYKCAKEIDSLFLKKIDIELSNEEKVYLILHINRVTEREISTRKVNTE